MVLKHMDHTIHEALPNADEIDTRGLFVGNHHWPLDEQFEYLRRALREIA